LADGAFLLLLQFSGSHFTTSLLSIHYVANSFQPDLKLISSRRLHHIYLARQGLKFLIKNLFQPSIYVHVVIKMQQKQCHRVNDSNYRTPY